MREHSANRQAVTFLFLLVALFAVTASAQRVASGRIHPGFAAKPAVNDTGSFLVNFATTAVGATSIEDCYYNCFFISGGTCNYSGTIALRKPLDAPFSVTNLRKGTVSTGCSGTPVTFPVTLQAGEVLLQDFVFSPVRAGTFTDTSVYFMTPDQGVGADFSWLLAGATPAAAPAIDSFSATPPTIRPGQPVTLSWTTSASNVSIDNGVGQKPGSGTVTVNPSVTTTYTLNAFNGNLQSTAQVTVTVVSTPALVISALPQPILQVSGTGGGTTSYTISNNGGAATNVTVTGDRTFFTQSPSSFQLAAGASQTITVTAAVTQAGVSEGTATISGSGTQSTLQVRISIFGTTPPASAVTAKPAERRIDVAGPTGASPSGTVSFTNSGTATLTGVLVSDVPWLIPQSGIVSIPGGSTANFTFTIDRSKRSDSDVGSSSASLTLVYLSGGASGKTGSNDVTPVPSVSLVTVVDTVQLAVGSNSAPPLAANEVALFVPGVGHVTGSVGKFISDVSVLNPPGNKSITDVQFFYSSIGGATQKSATLPPVGGPSVVLADLVKNVFGNDAQVGSLQIRSSSAAKLLVSTNIFNTTNPAGTYGTAIPTFRSDRAVAPGTTLVLTGLRSEAGSHTNLFIQETSGSTVTVQTEFISADGSTVGATRTDTVAPFALAQINNVVPAGAVSAILTNAPTSKGKFLAYATPVDEASGDNWSVVDWSRQFGYSGSEQVIIPVAGVLQGANNTFFRTDLSIMNTTSSAASGTLRFVSRSGEVIDRTINLGGRQSSNLGNVIGNLFGAASGSVGFMLFTPGSGSFVLTSRTYTTVIGQSATFGSGTPTIASSGTLKAGALRPIASLSDSSTATVTAGTPATFRTNFGLLETSGNGAVVRVTLRYNYPSGPKLQAIGSGSKDFTLNPNQFLLLNGLATQILGSSRDALGDLRGLEADFQVISGTGSVSVFTSSIDNGTGDSILRID
jgi:hypothetical protein